MQPQLIDLFNLAASRVIGSESLGLLVLGGLFLVLSFVRTRARRAGSLTSSSARALPRGASPLAAHQGH